MSNTSKRVIWADALKAWLMILVILGHSIQSVLQNDCFYNHLWNLIYSFHMPAFMAVSGYFFYKPISHKSFSFWKNCFRRVKQLLIPYFIWSTLSFIVSGNYSLAHFSKLVLYPDAFFWFLWVLFWINIISLTVEKIVEKLKFDFAIINTFVTLGLLLIMVLFEFRVLGFQFISYYYVFYFLGYLVHRFSLTTFFSKKSITLLLLIWFALAWFWRMHELPACFSTFNTIPLSLQQYLYRGFTAFLGVLVLFNVAPLLMNGSSRINIFMQSLGELSLGLYVCHCLYGGYIYLFLKQYSFLSECVIITVHFFICLVTVVPIVFFLARNSVLSRYLLGRL